MKTNKVTYKLFFDSFNSNMLQNNFKKRTKTWYKEKNDIIQLVNLQKSNWGEIFYLNIGLFFNELEDFEKLPPKVEKWHLYARYESLLNLSTSQTNKLFSLEGSHAEIISNINTINGVMKSNIIPLIEKLSDFAYLANNFYQTANFNGFFVQNISSKKLLAYFKEKVSRI